MDLKQARYRLRCFHKLLEEKCGAGAFICSTLCAPSQPLPPPKFGRDAKQIC